MVERYIGLMSGTSMDGIDAVLVQKHGDKLTVEAALCHPWPKTIANELHQLCLPSSNEIDRLGVADNQVAEQFAAATEALLRKANCPASAIRAIGSHGQTIRHRPQLNFTLQIGNNALLAALTGIDVIGDFRTMDMALGGQGAPLVPAFHQAMFAHPTQLRVVLNLGGIANISVLPGRADEVYGFDTGPANTLLDGWYRRHHLTGDLYDKNGQWAQSGQIIAPLLTQLLAHPYFAARYPKSTGREMFTLNWLDEQLNQHRYHPADVQRTLQALTSHSVALQLPKVSSAMQPALFICGGGAHNPSLLAELSQLLPDWQMDSTAALGLDPNWVEGAAFAWLAARFIERLPGNLPAVTGATRPAILGAHYLA